MASSTFGAWPSVGIVAASVTVTITVSGGDPVLGVYIPDFDPLSAGGQCVASNDDIGQGNLNSRSTFTLPARASGELIVWPFSASNTFNFTLTYSSTAPIAVLAP